SRGSFDHVRNGHRKFMPANPGLLAYGRRSMRQSVFALDSSELRTIVHGAIVEVCRFRSWPLVALHIRIMHLHAVVHAKKPASRIIHDWKAYSTRALREAGMIGSDAKIWTHGGN